MRQSEPHIAGMTAALQCYVNLDDAIDTQVDIAVEWQKDGGELNETIRVRALPPVLVGGSRYDALLQFSTLSSSTDSGNYMCLATVFPTESEGYIMNRTDTTSYILSVTGIALVLFTNCQLANPYFPLKIHRRAVTTEKQLFSMTMSFNYVHYN